MPPREPCTRAQAARHLVHCVLVEDENAPRPPSPPDNNESPPICIIGAGAAGLYTGMILDSLNIKYEILEASDRVGGRLYTHRFNGEEGKTAPIGDPKRYQYFDVGAMRFPCLPFQRPVFKLFEKLGLFRDGLMIEYKFTSKYTFGRYNGISHRGPLPGADEDRDVYEVSVSKGGPIPDHLVQQGAEEIIGKIVQPFANKFTCDGFEEGWKYLASFDHHTMRSYLIQVEQHTPAIVDWLETIMSGTGLFDGGFVQKVMNYLDFGLVDPECETGPTNYSVDRKPDHVPEDKPWERYDWWTVDGGIDHISERMREAIKVKPRTQCRVTKIKASGNTVLVTFDSPAGTQTKEYSQVVSTISLGCLGTVDFPERNDLGYIKRVAIRSLRYDSSAKVGVQFARRWWEDPVIMPEGTAIRGGQSKSDLSIRTAIYPSYGLDPSGRVPGVLIASYTWHQDAKRHGGLIHAQEGQDVLLRTVLNNLADLHGISVEDMDTVLGHYAWLWDTDINTRGAFAAFGPDQFASGPAKENLYVSMKTPAGVNQRIHIAGEATSVHHGWVLGAVNSAWRAVNNLLRFWDQETVDEFRKLWPAPEEEEGANSERLGDVARKHPEWSL